MTDGTLANALALLFAGKTDGEINDAIMQAAPRGALKAFCADHRYRIGHEFLIFRSEADVHRYRRDQAAPYIDKPDEEGTNDDVDTFWDSEEREGIAWWRHSL